MSADPARGPWVFLHLQKTGGSTVHHLLVSRLPQDRFAERDRSGFLVPTPAETLRDKIISGHVTAHFLNQFRGTARVFTVLREPVERMLSHFHFLKSYTREHLETFRNERMLRLKEMSLDAFLRDPEMNSWCGDYYVKRLDPAHDMSDPDSSPPDVGRALAFLKSCEVVGVTPRLAAFVRVALPLMGVAADADIPVVNRVRDLWSQPGFEPVNEEAPGPEHGELLAGLTRNDRVLFEHASLVAPKPVA